MNFLVNFLVSFLIFKYLQQNFMQINSKIVNLLKYFFILITYQNFENYLSCLQIHHFYRFFFATITSQLKYFLFHLICSIMVNFEKHFFIKIIKEFVNFF
jgi:hypothetical protein